MKSAAEKKSASDNSNQEKSIQTKEKEGQEESTQTKEKEDRVSKKKRRAEVLEEVVKIMF